MWSVIGNGVTGLCVATALADRGEPVEVLVDPRYPAASRLAGGMLAPYCEAEDAPQTVIQDGVAAIAWWKKHVSCVISHGTLVLAPARDSAELTRFADCTGHYQWVQPAEIEPDLEDRFARGLYYPDEAHLAPVAALDELGSALVSRGVVFREGAARGTPIDCRGIAARDRLRDLRAVRGEMLEFTTTEIKLSRPLRLLHPRFPCYVVPRGTGRFMLGATMVESADPGPISARALMELLSSAYAIHPAFAEARVIQTGTGLRPAFPGNLPEIRRADGTFYVNGMYRHGFLLAPIMAEKLMQQL